MNETIVRSPVGRPRKLKEADFALLGTDNDNHVAAKLGVSTSSVRLARVRLGIPAVRRNYLKGVRKNTSPLFSIPIEEFSTTRDCDLAAKYGVSRERIRQVRAERGIPKCGKRGPVPRERRKCLACGGVLSLKTKGEHCIRCLVPHGRKTKPCEVCGKPFWKQQGVIRTCSKECTSKLMSLSHGGSGVAYEKQRSPLCVVCGADHDRMAHTCSKMCGIKLAARRSSESRKRNNAARKAAKTG